MNLSATIPLVGLLVVGTLPLLVFRTGQFNLRWLATAAPFFMSAIVLFLGAGEKLAPWFTFGIASMAIAIIGTTLAVLLIVATVRSHKRTPALWHQDEITPTQLVTWGTYRYVRHPFYTAFLLLLATAFLTLPSVWTAGTFAYAVIALDVTARGEEETLRAVFGAEFERYRQHTGCFVPPILSLRQTGAGA